jgi:hypothetical protein
MDVVLTVTEVPGLCKTIRRVSLLRIGLKSSGSVPKLSPQDTGEHGGERY